ncbi:hypothetical protein NDU88_011320 [Pleurodeles waltl]|uniref:Uncharacterized protein n=1 Tax=Pleurodeles waltl TaxID=8319 RepID=A0AAV7QYA2_PLEWA|nr:hypothetical protein NDU88_011320 [Pleurodeles waltl]
MQDAGGQEKHRASEQRGADEGEAHERAGNRFHFRVCVALLKGPAKACHDLHPVNWVHQWKSAVQPQ